MHRFCHLLYAFVVVSSGKVTVLRRNGTRRPFPFLENARSVQPGDAVLVGGGDEEGRRQGGYKNTCLDGFEPPSTHFPIRLIPRDRPLRLFQQWVKNKKRRQHWSCKIINGVS